MHPLLLLLSAYFHINCCHIHSSIPLRTVIWVDGENYTFVAQTFSELTSACPAHFHPPHHTNRYVDRNGDNIFFYKFFYLLNFPPVIPTAQSASVTYKSGLRREFCSWGAQYWCSGTKTAALCGKTDWCISNHWNRHVIPVSCV